MNFHTRLVGAFDAIIISLTVAVLMAALFDVSSNRAEKMLSKRGTVTIQQVAASDIAPVRHMYGSARCF